MNDARITIIHRSDGTPDICTVTTAEGQSIASQRDTERFDTAVSQGRLLRFDYGGVIWYEPVNDSNRHMLRVSAPKVEKVKDPNRVETRGRKRGPNYGKHVKQPGVGKGGNVYRKPIPKNVVVALKESGLSGSEVAMELSQRVTGMFPAITPTG